MSRRFRSNYLVPLSSQLFRICVSWLKVSCSLAYPWISTDRLVSKYKNTSFFFFWTRTIFGIFRWGIWFISLLLFKSIVPRFFFSRRQFSRRSGRVGKGTRLRFLSVPIECEWRRTGAWGRSAAAEGRVTFKFYRRHDYIIECRDTANGIAAKSSKHNRKNNRAFFFYIRTLGSKANSGGSSG